MLDRSSAENVHTGTHTVYNHRCTYSTHAAHLRALHQTVYLLMRLFKKRRRRRKNADTERVLNHPSESLKENCSERHAGEGREREEEEGGRKVGSGQGDFFSNAGMLATCCFSLSLHRSISPVVRWGKMHAVNTDMGEGFDPSLHLSLFPFSCYPTLPCSSLLASHSMFFSSLSIAFK